MGENRYNMRYTWYQMAWIVLIYSCLGWCSEVAFAALRRGVFVNRGFLNGPVCPIYGFGVLLVSALLTAIYMFQIAVRAWFPRHSAPAIPEGSVHEAGWQMLVPMVVLAAACLLMGLMPQGLLDLIREAVTL